MTTSQDGLAALLGEVATPGAEPVVLASDLRPGQHVAALGADVAGKSEVELEALARCRLFCDDWAQASTPGCATPGRSPGAG